MRKYRTYKRPVESLAALAPKPRVNLTRYHGVFAPNSKHRAWVTPTRRGKGNWKVAADQDEEIGKEPESSGLCTLGAGMGSFRLARKRSEKKGLIELGCVLKCDGARPIETLREPITRTL